MFRKIVSNLPFSPALIGQIGFYARRLRKEEASRRLGLFITILALIAQSFAVFTPPAPANASSSADFVSGGVSSVTDFLHYYDRNTNNIRDLFNSLGITRSEVAATTTTTVKSTDGIYTWGLLPHYSYAQGERTYSAGGRTFYYRSLHLWDTTHGISGGVNYTAFVGHSAKAGWFGINKNCGNLLLKTKPVTPTRIAVCRPDVGVISIDERDKKPTDLPANSEKCKPKAPASMCQTISEKKIDRTKRNFTAKAGAANGATISAYVFTVRKDSATGAIVKTITVPSTAAEAQSGAIDLKDAGKYYVNVVVKTSLGDKTAALCALLVTVVPPEKCEVNPSLPSKNDIECKPCPANPNLWYKSPECNEVVVQSKTATNLTQNNVEASSVTAVGGDRIQYTITIDNPGKVPATAIFKEELRDVIEYASLQDTSGGVYDAATKTLSWPNVVLAAGEKQSRTFIIALPQQIPTMAQGVSDPTSYDCVMSNTFGNNIEIHVSCDAPKVVEQTVKNLPSTGPRENLIFGGILLAVVTYFWARSRQLGKEVRLVRKDFNASTI